ncbi:MAG: hypothetical protein FJZ96_03190 [Chloroflexi bacterium]|nr:hypothetical protein [Chloroflexota bacterium]
MTDQERNQVLKMVEEGKISANEGLRLIRALEENAAEEQIEAVEAAAGPWSESQSDPEITRRIERLRSHLWQIPLWIGIATVILGGWLVYAVMRNTGMGFWFYCSWLPFLLGVLLLATAWGSRTARWLHVRVKRKADREGPKNIALSFPLPLRLTSWAVRTFAHNLKDLEKTAVDEVAQALEQSVNSDAPLYVEVDEAGDEDVEHVQVYIG